MAFQHVHQTDEETSTSTTDFIPTHRVNALMPTPQVPSMQLGAQVPAIQLMPEISTNAVTPLIQRSAECTSTTNNTLIDGHISTADTWRETAKKWFKDLWMAMGKYKKKRLKSGRFRLGPRKPFMDQLELVKRHYQISWPLKPDTDGAYTSQDFLDLMLEINTIYQNYKSVDLYGTSFKCDGASFCGSAGGGHVRLACTAPGSKESHINMDIFKGLSVDHQTNTILHEAAHASDSKFSRDNDLYCYQKGYPAGIYNAAGFANCAEDIVKGWGWTCHATTPTISDEDLEKMLEDKGNDWEPKKTTPISPF